MGNRNKVAWLSLAFSESSFRLKNLKIQSNSSRLESSKSVSAGGAASEVFCQKAFEKISRYFVKLEKVCQTDTVSLANLKLVSGFALL